MTYDKYDNSPTLSGTMTRLREEGYTEDFNLGSDCLECGGNRLQVSPEDFQIDKFYRFEGESNPADSAILYAISSEKYNVKGVLVNGYGIYSDDLSDKMLKKLKTH